MKKILFLLKQNRPYGDEYSYTSKSGLLNSAKLTSEFLEQRGVAQTKIAICVDGNSVDKEVYDFKPDVCVIEALWVTPEKLEEVQRLHPKVSFVVRVHSEVAFLSIEGVALDWINRYNYINNVTICFNSRNTYRDFKKALSLIHIGYLPNLYPMQSEVGIRGITKRYIQFVMDRSKPRFPRRPIEIASFGSIRPLKNQLVQAVAALRFGNKYNVPVNFHINGTRPEQGGGSVLSNIRSLFEYSKHNLVEHEWLEREDFLKLIRKMDVGMQMSFSESFNIVSADFISQKVPIIVSNDIEWMPSVTKSEPTDTERIVKQLSNALNYEDLFVDSSILSLNKYNIKAFLAWIDFLY